MLPSSRDSSGTENTEGCPPGLGSHISTSASGCSFRTAISSGRSGSGAGFSSRRASSTTCPAGPSEPDSVSSECNDPLRTNLNAYHGMVVFDALILAGHFAKVRHLSDCCRSDGKVELHRWETSRPEGEDSMVVVKRVLASRVNENRDKEACEHVVYQTRISRDAEDTLTEIGIYCYLARQADMPQYLLKMHTVFESGSDVWLVLEHADGGDLFGIVQANGGVEAKQLLRWMWELLQAVQYLHKRSIGHRDISIENVLLRQGAVRLMDFGQAVATHSVDGMTLRYSRPIGKPYYRPAECYVPTEPMVRVAMPAAAAEGDVVFARTDNAFLCEVRLASSSPPGLQTSAVPWGYAAAPVDIYACAICLFIMATGMPPYRQAKLDDPHFVWVRNNGIAALLGAWRKPLQAETLTLLEAAMRPDPAVRSTAEACLQEPCFAPFRSESVPTHNAPVLRSALLSGEGVTAHPAAAPSIAEQLAGAHVGGVVGGDWPESVRSTGLAGDFYTVGEAQRSACAGEPRPLAFAGAQVSSFASCTGDFYCSASDAPRSVCGDFYASGLDGAHIGDGLLSCGAAGAAKLSTVPAGLPLERFCAGSGTRAQPPEVSSSSVLEKTKIHVSGGAAPTEIGNLPTLVHKERSSAEAGTVSLGSDSGKAPRLTSEGGERQATPIRADAAVARTIPVPPPLQSKASAGSRPGSGKAAASAAAALALSPQPQLRISTAPATPNGGSSSCSYGNCSRPGSASSAPAAPCPPLPRSPTASTPAPRRVDAAHVVQLHGAGWPPTSPGVKGLLQRRRRATSSSLTPVPPTGTAPSQHLLVSGVVRRPSSTSAVKRIVAGPR